MDTAFGISDPAAREERIKKTFEEALRGRAPMPQFLERTRGEEYQTTSVGESGFPLRPRQGSMQARKGRETSGRAEGAVVGEKNKSSGVDKSSMRSEEEKQGR